MSSTRRGNKGRTASEHHANPAGSKSGDIFNSEAVTEAETSTNTASTPASRVAITTTDDIGEGSDLKAFIADALTNQTSEIMRKIDSVNSEIKELHEKTSNILSSVQYNAEQIEHNTDEIDRLKKEMGEMKTDFVKRLLTQELYSRKSNLLSYGVPDERDPDTASREIFRLLGVEGADNMLFVNVHRLPRKSTDPVNFRATMPKPIVVKFMRAEDRQKVFNASIKSWARLAEKRVTIRTDLPVILKKLRGRLSNRVFELRKSNNVQTRIQERGIDVFLQIRKSPSDAWRTIGIEENP